MPRHDGDKRSLVLLTRDNCELCLKASAMIEAVDAGTGSGLPFCLINIEDDPFLKQRYDWLIPVVYRTRLNLEIPQGSFLASADSRAVAAELSDLLDGDASRELLMSYELGWPFPPSRLREFILSPH